MYMNTRVRKGGNFKEGGTGKEKHVSVMLISRDGLAWVLVFKELPMAPKRKGVEKVLHYLKTTGHRM